MSRTQLGFVGVLWLVFLAGCAGERGRYADQAHPAGGRIFCRSGGTPTCFERLGKPVSARVLRETILYDCSTGADSRHRIAASERRQEGTSEAPHSSDSCVIFA